MTVAISIESGNLLSDAVASLATACPTGWRRAAVYIELRREREGDLNNASMMVCYKGQQPVTDVSLTDEAYATFVSLFERSVGEGNDWSAMRLEFDATGRFKSKFYFDSWPLIDADYSAAEKGLDDPSAP